MDTRRIRKVWYGSYHSRSQWVWGTTAMRRAPVRSGPEASVVPMVLLSSTRRSPAGCVVPTGIVGQPGGR